MIIDPSVIRQVSREKDIDPEKMFGALEEAMSSAARKFYHDKAVVTSIDRKTGEMIAFSRRTVVDELDTESEEPPPQILMDEAKELIAKHGTKGDVRILRPAGEGEPAVEVSEIALGDEIRLYRSTGASAASPPRAPSRSSIRRSARPSATTSTTSTFRRSASSSAGTVKRFERGDMIVDLGRTEAAIPREHQSRAERYAQGERVRGVLADVHKNPKGSQIILSRTARELLMRLMEMEVPEIYDGTVVIRGCVRQPGDRAKVAVSSRERDVDPVGACVGMRGTRVQAIMRELRGERIDIIQYSDDLITYAQNALSPAKITRVSAMPPTTIRARTESHEPVPTLECVVEDDQLSLAIGKQGPERPPRGGPHRRSNIEIKGERTSRPRSPRLSSGCSTRRSGGRPCCRRRGHRREDDREARGGRHHEPRRPPRQERRGARGNPGARREDRGENPGSRARVRLRSGDRVGERGRGRRGERKRFGDGRRNDRRGVIELVWERFESKSWPRRWGSAARKSSSFCNRSAWT